MGQEMKLNIKNITCILKIILIYALNSSLNKKKAKPTPPKLLGIPAWPSMALSIPAGGKPCTAMAVCPEFTSAHARRNDCCWRAQGLWVERNSKSPSARQWQMCQGREGRQSVKWMWYTQTPQSVQWVERKAPGTSRAPAQLWNGEGPLTASLIMG